MASPEGLASKQAGFTAAAVPRDVHLAGSLGREERRGRGGARALRAGGWAGAGAQRPPQAGRPRSWARLSWVDAERATCLPSFRRYRSWPQRRTGNCEILTSLSGASGPNGTQTPPAPWPRRIRPGRHAELDFWRRVELQKKTFFRGKSREKKPSDLTRKGALRNCGLYVSDSRFTSRGTNRLSW